MRIGGNPLRGRNRSRSSHPTPTPGAAQFITPDTVATAACSVRDRAVCYCRILMSWKPTLQGGVRDNEHGFPRLEELPDALGIAGRRLLGTHQYAIICMMLRVGPQELAQAL